MSLDFPDQEKWLEYRKPRVSKARDILAIGKGTLRVHGGFPPPKNTRQRRRARNLLRGYYNYD